MKTATELLKEKLIEIGADGLYNYTFPCSCTIDIFVPCGMVTRECVPAQNNPQKAVKMECKFLMEPMKEQNENNPE